MTPLTRRHATRLLRRAASVAMAVLAVGCGDLARMITPGRESDEQPARVALTASVARNIGTAADVIALRVTASYARTAGTRVPLSTQTVTLNDAATQQVPLTMDIGPCLRDADHLGAGGDAGSVCTVFLALELQVNGSTLDQSTVGPLSLKIGTITSVTEPVALYNIVSVGVAKIGGTVVGPSERLTVAPGGTLNLEAQVRDAAGRLVGGRPATWTSDNVDAASVDVGTGVVTGKAPGTARITATAAGRTASATVDVVRPPVSLTVSAITSSGAGTISSVPAGINCRITTAGTSGVCAFNFAADAQVTLSASADAGAQFGPWGDVCASAGSTPVCVLSMTQPRAVSARFSALRRLTVISTGTGNGRITSVPAGIDCQIAGPTATGSCFFDVVDGTSVTLTGTASTQHVLQGWSVDCVAAVGTSCTLPMTGSPRTAGVRFVEPQLLTVAPTGAGTGSVTGTGGINCIRSVSGNSGVCSASFQFNSVAALTAVAGATSTFGNWTGACAAVQLPTCNVTMDQARSVGVQFNKAQVPLSITLNGSGAGTLSVNGVTACTKTQQQTSVQCTASVDVGSTAQLVAQPGAQATFLTYSGACSGSLPQCQVVMTVATAVTATFQSAPVQVSVVSLFPSTANGTVQTTTGSILCNYVAGVASGICSTSIPAGTTITLTATAGANSAFVQWGGACAGVQLTQCTLTPAAPVSLSARFNIGVQISVLLLAMSPGTVQYSSPGLPALDTCFANTPAPNGVQCDYRVPLGATVTFQIFPSGGSSAIWDIPCGMTGLTCTIQATQDSLLVATIFESGGAIRASAPMRIRPPEKGGAKPPAVQMPAKPSPPPALSRSKR